MSCKFRTLIIDDEWLAREGLRRLLVKFPEIEIVGEADCVGSAARLIEETKPDVVFLDIQMPDDNGFALFDKVEADFKVIFVTAFDDFAIRAFEVNALDYLLKPINMDRLSQSIRRLSEQNRKERLTVDKLSYDDYVFSKNKDNIGFVRVNAIVYIMAAGDYSEVFLMTGEKRIALRSLAEWEGSLPDKDFIRIHRNTIINLNCVDKVEPWAKSTFQISLKNVARPFITSQKYSKELRRKFV